MGSWSTPELRDTLGKLIMNFLHNDFHANNLQIFSEVSLIIPNSKYFYQGSIASTCFALGDALRKSDIGIATDVPPDLCFDHLFLPLCTYCK